MPLPLQEPNAESGTGNTFLANAFYKTGGCG